MKSASIALLSLVLLAGCDGDGERNRAVPRPVAYPRIAVPDSVYRQVDVEGVKLRVNESASARVKPAAGGVWIDIDYDMFGSPRVYLTLTECGPEGREAVLANRREREMLNLGGQRCEIMELLTPGGWNCRMTVARGSMTIPVQILAHDDSRVLSGALTVELPDSLAADPSAIAPVVEAVSRDMLVLLKGLGDE